MLVLHARLMPDDGAQLVKAIRTLLASDTSVPVAARRASALAMVAGAAPSGTSAHIEDAVAISTTTAERLCCDAAVVPMLEGQDGELLSIGCRSRTIPPSIRRAMNARDQGCRFPACTHTRFLHGHRIRRWAHQGETSLLNLVTLCSYHHMLVHEGGFSIVRMASGDIECFTPKGRRIEVAAPTRHGDANTIIDNNGALGLRVSAEPLMAARRRPAALKLDGLAPVVSCRGSVSQETCASKWGGALGTAFRRTRT